MMVAIFWDKEVGGAVRVAVGEVVGWGKEDEALSFISFSLYVFFFPYSCIYYLLFYLIFFPPFFSEERKF